MTSSPKSKYCMTCSNSEGFFGGGGGGGALWKVPNPTPAPNLYSGVKYRILTRNFPGSSELLHDN